MGRIFFFYTTDDHGSTLGSVSKYHQKDIAHAVKENRGNQKSETSGCVAKATRGERMSCHSVCPAKANLRTKSCSPFWKAGTVLGATMFGGNRL